MQPRKDLLVIEIQPEPKEEKVDGLWIQPPRWAKPQSIAKVIAVGPLVTDLVAGDFILINPYAYIDTKDTMTKVIREDDILCKIESQDL